MTPLEAARRLLSVYGKPAMHPWVECDHGDCHLFASCHHAWPERCEFLMHEHPHVSDPVLMLPQVVAALEAAEKVAACTTPTNGLEGICWYCEEDMYEAHAADCVWTAFTAALKGGA